MGKRRLSRSLFPIPLAHANFFVTLTVKLRTGGIVEGQEIWRASSDTETSYSQGTLLSIETVLSGEFR